VDYQDTAGAWRSSAAWPPAEARAEALFLAGEALAPAPGDAPRSFRAAWVPFTEAHCDLDAGLGLRYLSEPLAQRAVLAGNPFAHLEVASDRPGGGFTLALLDLPADATCQDFLEPGEEGLISYGSVDLQYHRGTFRAKDFPAGAPQPVRVDLFNQAWVVEPGRRIGLAVLRDLWEFGPHQPEITLHPGSHLVLPLVEGTLGGGPLPGVDYLPRPFVPAG
jgi:predicted acyl esterase